MRRVLSLVIAVSVLVSLLALAPGAGAATPTGWTRIADKGIDNPNIPLMVPSVEFQGKLYFWVPYFGGTDAAPVWSYDGTTFSKQGVADGFGDPGNIALNGGIVYQGYLYMGTANGSGGQVWRTADGTTWERVGETTFTDPNEPSAQLLGEQGGKLIIEFNDYNVGVKVWAYDGTDPSSPSAFTRANNDGFGLNVSSSVRCSETSNGAQFNGRVQVCANLYNASNGNMISFAALEYRGGTTWVQTAQNNFGDANNINGVSLMATVGGAAYAGTQNNSGGQLWKLDGSGWNRVPTGGINPAQSNLVVPAALGDQLEVCTSMSSTEGMPVGPAQVYLQNPDGSFFLWIDQFDDPGNMVIVASEFKGQYVAGAGNQGGFQVWSKSAVPFIESTSPDTGPYGELVTISGSNFGSTRGTSYVSFGTKKATSYTSWTSTKIKVKVPSGCYWTREVSVTTWAGTSNAKTFKVKPHISAISPTSGSVGAYITVGGTGFGSSKSTSSVKFGTKLAYTSSTSWTNVKVKAKVPTLSKGKTYITVTTRGGTSNKYTFTVK